MWQLIAVPENRYCISLHYTLVKGRSERFNELPKATWWVLAGSEDTMFLAPNPQGQMRGAVPALCKGGKPQQPLSHVVRGGAQSGAGPWGLGKRKSGHVFGLRAVAGHLTIWSRLWKWQGLRAGGTGGGGSGDGRARSRRSSSSISSSRCTRAGAATPKRQARRPSSSRHNTTLFTFLRSTRSSVSNMSTSGVGQREEDTGSSPPLEPIPRQG